MNAAWDDVTFTITATMSERWVPHFLGLLREMQRLGQIGSSRPLGFFADGDGDFRPRFDADVDVEPAAPSTVDMGTPMWDAG